MIGEFRGRAYPIQIAFEVIETDADSFFRGGI